MKTKLQALKALSVRSILGGVATLPVLAHAEGGGVDYGPMLAKIDFATTTAAVLSIAALLAGLYMAIKGAKIVIGMVRGA
ncbi:hypothetical protein WI73_24565 [Burkholderia ubonensis]|uniref:hypothetical protein n=1 Tax=Burkholderia TaxID=32008 RepID=UPI00050FA0D0|nr:MULTISPECIES: hypothetical protein [Burkholderia]KGC31977.1 putative membrane protein [Burkholderia pseudomallei]KVC62805.1 hypothetical protein WI73_24565 [Burkholderia ubonensis]KVC97399.1 hypothetical protein WI79_24715 [Burkholderia ubonensis]KVD72981.1 hypothetical protein WI89_13100 [Burkholderia ubonensis]KVG25279.1 hypothetical protein WJ29_00155 [Burkholderia ubonensis]